MTMRENTTSKLYNLWALFYDYTFGYLVVKRQRRAAEQLSLLAQPGDTILDVGVGTGMLLQHYPRDVQIVGVDLSAGMLAKAQEKQHEQNLEHIQLMQADAMFLPFADQSFDHIIMTHTISVVSDPNRLLQLCSRLVKPGGRIVVLNHFQSTHPVLGWFERVTNPIFARIGWNSDTSLQGVLEGGDLEVDYCFKLRMVDLWKIVVLRHRQPQTANAPEIVTDAPTAEPSQHLSLQS